MERNEHNSRIINVLHEEGLRNLQSVIAPDSEIMEEEDTIYFCGKKTRYEHRRKN